MMTTAKTSERLRQEYLGKLENSAPLFWGYQNKGGFYFDGHRLSSLYRATILNVIWLRKSLRNSFFFEEILKSNTNQKVTS